ncbi:hypothetical protein RB195_011601 [Necator americanus]
MVGLHKGGMTKVAFAQSHGSTRGTVGRIINKLQTFGRIEDGLRSGRSRSDAESVDSGHRSKARRLASKAQYESDSPRAKVVQVYCLNHRQETARVDPSLYS